MELRAYLAVPAVRLCRARRAGLRIPAGLELQGSRGYHGHQGGRGCPAQGGRGRPSRRSCLEILRRLESVCISIAVEDFIFVLLWNCLKQKARLLIKLHVSKYKSERDLKAIAAYCCFPICCTLKRTPIWCTVGWRVWLKLLDWAPRTEVVINSVEYFAHLHFTCGGLSQQREEMLYPLPRGNVLTEPSTITIWFIKTCNDSMQPPSGAMHKKIT